MRLVFALGRLVVLVTGGLVFALGLVLIWWIIWNAIQVFV